MGFFDFLLGKKKTTDESEGSETAHAGGASSSPESPVASPWRQRLERATRADDFDWDWDNPKARALVTEILTEAAPRFGDAKVKEIPDDGHIDLRGSFDGAPIRFAVWMSFGSFWSIETRCPNRIGELNIERDHEKIPKQKDEDDPWSEDEDRRVFIAKGIFVEGGDEDVAQKLDTWATLPEPLQARILADMERLDIRSVRSYSDNVSLNQRPGLPELDDPITYMEDCARLMAAIKDAIDEGHRDPASTPSVRIRGAVEINGVLMQPNVGPASTGTHERLTCKFCSSMFLLTPTHHNCPNCGAPPQG